MIELKKKKSFRFGYPNLAKSIMRIVGDMVDETFFVFSIVCKWAFFVFEIVLYSVNILLFCYIF